MEHIYSVDAYYVPDVMELLDAENIDYEINDNQFIISDEDDLLFQSCLISHDIDYSDDTGGFIVGNSLKAVHV